MSPSKAKAAPDAATPGAAEGRKCEVLSTSFYSIWQANVNTENEKRLRPD